MTNDERLFRSDLVKFCAVENSDNSKVTILVALEEDGSGGYCLPHTYYASNPNAAVRELSSRYGIANNPSCFGMRDVPEMSSLYFDTGRVVSYAEASTMFPLRELPANLSDSDLKTIEEAIESLKVKLRQASVVATLLPEMFTLPAIRSVYEQVSGNAVDARNFRRKMLGDEPKSASLLSPTSGVQLKGVPGRPPVLYKISNLWLEESSGTQDVHYPKIRSAK